MIGEFDQILNGDRARALFVSAIHLTLAPQKIGNVLLRQIVIDSQIRQPSDIQALIPPLTMLPFGGII